MQFFNKTNLANAEASWLIPILSKFSCFSTPEAVIAIDYFVAPIGRDRSYVILQSSEVTYVLATVDYPDPLHDAAELTELSKKYTFASVITPTKGRLINVGDIEADNVGDDFFVKIGTAYYYCAPIEYV